MAIDILVDEDLSGHDPPDAQAVERACRAALAAAKFPDGDYALCVRFADDEAVRRLNRAWRGVDTVTDVLAFPMQEGPTYGADEPLGDIVLAWPYVCTEARRLGRRAEDHAMHLVIHGCLHLIGYDHAEPEERARMRACERRALRALGRHDPYSETTDV